MKMKNFTIPNHFKNIMILLILCLGVFTIYSIVQMKYLEKFMDKGSFQSLNKEQVKPDVVFVGSSHVKYHLSYPYFAYQHISIFNLGEKSSSGISSLSRLLKYLNQVHYKPKMVFFDGFFLQRNSLFLYYINSKDIITQYIKLSNHHFGFKHGNYILSGVTQGLREKDLKRSDYKMKIKNPKQVYLESLKILKTTPMHISHSSSYYQYIHFLFEKVMNLAQKYHIQMFITYISYPTVKRQDNYSTPIADIDNKSNYALTKKLAQDFHVPFIDFYDSYNDIMLDLYQTPLLDTFHFLPIFNHTSMLLYQKVKNMGYSWPIAPIDQSFLNVYRDYWNNKNIKLILKETKEIRNDKQYQKYISFPKKEWL